LKTLLIDNYDSFTFNLFQYLAQINGEPPIVVRNDEMSWSEASRLQIDNIVLSPGPGRPELEKDFGICRQAILESGLPILGVCLGHQGIGYLFGGTVRPAPRVMHGRLSDIVHEGDGIFQGLPSPLRAVRYHSLIVDSKLPEVLRATAWTPDGVLMGLAHRSKPIWGVQFHPESICSDHGLAVLKNFRELSEAARRRTFLPPVIRPEAGSRARCTLHYRRSSQFADPESVFSHYFSKSEGAYWLHSATLCEGMARFSFMGDCSGPMSYLVAYRCAERRLQITRHGHESVLVQSIFDFLAHETERHRCEDAGLPFDFAGGFVGYLGYELKDECGGQGPHRCAQPDAMFIFSDRFLAFDHVAKELYLVAVTEAGDASPDSWFDSMQKGLGEMGPPPPLQHGNQQEAVTFRLQHGRSEYLARIETALREIDAGETYEVCLTNKLSTARAGLDDLTLYRTLQQINPAPFSAFLKFPGVAVLCSSPERFLRIDRSGRVEAKPIKGTMRRGKDCDEDARLAQQLRTDEKSRSENLMIVDLLRNDLGRVCETGSVHVSKLMEVETYATVHQLVSTVRGRLAGCRNAVDGIRSAFPGGSMTGAPKIRTMQIIDRLEGAARGIYSGSIGYLSLNGSTDLNIVIRTIVAADNQLSIGVGGAIIALSDPIAEFDETMLKAKALVQAIVIAQRGTMDGTAFVIDGA
jgi:para-aminobenzoate synthetase